MASHATQTFPLIAGVSAIAGHDRRTPPTHGEEDVPDEGPGHVVDAPAASSAVVFEDDR